MLLPVFRLKKNVTVLFQSCLVVNASPPLEGTASPVELKSGIPRDDFSGVLLSRFRLSLTHSLLTFRITTLVNWLGTQRCRRAAFPYPLERAAEAGCKACRRWRGSRFVVAFTRRLRGRYETAVAARAARTFSHLNGGCRPRLTSSRRFAAALMANLVHSTPSTFFVPEFRNSLFSAGLNSLPPLRGWIHYPQLLNGFPWMAAMTIIVPTIIANGAKTAPPHQFG